MIFERKPDKNKEFLYVGYYFDTNNRFILKVGTTNNLKRRQKEHTSKYRNSPDYTLPNNKSFEYLWCLPLSKYNTLRYEDKTKLTWAKAGIGEYIRNDRFYCKNIPDIVEVAIKKTYYITVKKTVEND